MTSFNGAEVIHLDDFRLLRGRLPHPRRDLLHQAGVTHPADGAPSRDCLILADAREAGVIASLLDQVPGRDGGASLPEGIAVRVRGARVPSVVALSAAEASLLSERLLAATISSASGTGRAAVLAALSARVILGDEPPAGPVFPTRHADGVLVEHVEDMRVCGRGPTFAAGIIDMIRMHGPMATAPMGFDIPGDLQFEGDLARLANVVRGITNRASSMPRLAALDVLARIGHPVTDRFTPNSRLAWVLEQISPARGTA